MDKKKIELIITGVLGFVLIVIVLANVQKYFQGKAEDYGSGSSPVSMETFSHKNEIPVQREDHLVWGRDPFYLDEKPASAAGAVTVFYLTGVSTGPRGKPMAVINNEMVTVGSKLGKYTVVKIFKDKVLLSHGSEVLEVKMSQ